MIYIGTVKEVSANEALVSIPELGGDVPSLILQLLSNPNDSVLNVGEQVAVLVDKSRCIVLGVIYSTQPDSFRKLFLSLLEVLKGFSLGTSQGQTTGVLPSIVSKLDEIENDFKKVFKEV